MGTQLQGVRITLPDGGISDQDISTTAAIQRTKLEEVSDDFFGVPLSSGFVWDAAHTNLPGTAATDDLALVTGTLGTDAIKLSTGDVKNATTTRRVGFVAYVPPNYKDGSTFSVRVRAGIEDNAADTSATVDLEVYKADGDGAVGADLCQTSAVNINSTTLTNADFTIAAASIDPGDQLQMRIGIAVTDGQASNAVTAIVTNLGLLVSTQG